MKKNKLNLKQQINAELVSRSFNQKAKNVIKRSNPDKALADLVIEFYCECSDKTCQERVPLTIKQYEKIHNNRAKFVLAKGHEQFPVDKIKTRADIFTIVEKPALTTGES